MKSWLNAIFLSLGFAASAGNTAVVFSDEFESTEGWFKNPACNAPKYGGGGSFQLTGNGKSGKCLKVVTGSKQIFMFNLRKRIPVKNGCRLRISFLVQGKGIISIRPMGRSSDRKTIYLSANTQLEKINTDEWEKIPFIVPFRDPKGADLKDFVLRLNVRPDSELLIDNCIIEEMH